MLNSIFKIISFYNDIRWQSASNYNLINFYKDNLDADTKLLTHWLCYITDRQMAFERIWDIAGFIFSELIDIIKHERTLELLDPSNPKAFIARKVDGFVFTSISKSDDNEILSRYSIPSSEVVTFASRYYPSDYFSILYTLSFLERHNYSLTKYIAECYRKHEDNDDYITRILFSLYLITYHEIGQPSKKDLGDFNKNLDRANKHTEKVMSVLNSDDEFEREYKFFCVNKKYGQKRAWCSLRDFFISPEFNVYFRKSLQEHGFKNEDFKKIFSIESFRQFELPGDVWNNNSRFRKCILEGTEYQESRKDLNIILREYFDKNKHDLEGCYPEQFDVTFDFVPRMCMKNLCNICPIGLVKNPDKSNFYKTCNKNTDYYCSVALMNCGYAIDCSGHDCKLLQCL